MNNRNKIIWSNIAVTFVSTFLYMTVLHLWSANGALGAAIMVLLIIAIIAGSTMAEPGDVGEYAILLAVFGAALSLAAEDLFYRTLSTVGVAVAVTCMLLAICVFLMYARWIIKKFAIKRGVLVWTLCLQSVAMDFLIMYGRKLT